MGKQDALRDCVSWLVEPLYVNRLPRLVQSTHHLGAEVLAKTHRLSLAAFGENQNALERGADGCGGGVGIGGLLFAGQEKQMVALCCIQIKDPCQALQDLCGNHNSVALLQAGIPGHSDAC